MRHYNLEGFLEKLDYEITPDVEEDILKLCAMTKCRADPNRFVGYESCYLFLALEAKFGFKRFLEFGTGRGTTSFLMALCSEMETVITIDWVSSYRKQQTWCNYQNVLMSVNEIHQECVKALGKPDVDIRRINSSSENLATGNIVGGPFDLIYIDGSHDCGPVKHDYELAEQLRADDAIIVLDDYDPQYGVHQAVNEMIPEEDRILVSLNGHRYGPDQEPDNCGHIIVATGKYKELFNE